MRNQAGDGRIRLQRDLRFHFIIVRAGRNHEFRCLSRPASTTRSFGGSLEKTRPIFDRSVCSLACRRVVHLQNDIGTRLDQHGLARL